MQTPERFVVRGMVLRLEPGRRSPGTPPEHIVDASGAHVSLAFREVLDRPSVLFDMPRADMPKVRDGFRLWMDTGEVEPFQVKATYYNARTASGWPCLRRKKPT